MPPFKVFILALLFPSIACNYCIAQDDNNWVLDIRAKYHEIRGNLYAYDTTELDLWGESTEGGHAVVYYEGHDLKLVEVVWYGETGKHQTDYYLDSMEVIFVFDQNFYYNKPIYWDENRVKETGDNEVFDPTKTTVQENRYYFNNEKLFLWLDNDKKKQDMNLGKNLRVGVEIIIQFNELLSNLKISKD